MKKFILILLALTITYLSLNNYYDNKFIIPADAIRLRVIPNSNSSYDQEIKMKVSKQIQNRMARLLEHTSNVEGARKIITNNLDLLKLEVANLLKKENYSLDYDINFGFHYFPEKEFKGVVYQEGYYEAVKVTLGEGLGDNWWCVLFPPLCLVEAEEGEEIEYKFFVEEIFKKYFRI